MWLQNYILVFFQHNWNPSNVSTPFQQKTIYVGRLKGGLNPSNMKSKWSDDKRFLHEQEPLAVGQWSGLMKI